MITKKQVRQARQRLTLAKEQHDSAAVNAWEPAEPAECVTKCFYALENALTAAVLVLGETPTTKHYEKSNLAKQLASQSKLKQDISKRLNELNDLRKDVQYGQPGTELANADLEDILGEIEGFIDEVESLVEKAEKSQTK